MKCRYLSTLLYQSMLQLRSLSQISHLLIRYIQYLKILICTCRRRVEGNPQLFQHALDGLGLLEANAEGQLDPLGAKRDTTRPDIRPSDPVLGKRNC
jgi:hypothetical protein